MNKNKFNSSVGNKLGLYSELKNELTKMRISCHLVPIESGRYKKIPSVERLCPFVIDLKLVTNSTTVEPVLSGQESCSVRLIQVSIDNTIWGVKCHLNEQWKHLEYSQRLWRYTFAWIKFIYQSGPVDHSTLNIGCNSNLKKSDEWKKLYTNKTK